MNKYRLKFQKKEKMIYIGHLDLLTFFQRAVKRAELPIAYSKGFNPHQQMSFAAPLSLGSYGYGEYVDIELEEPVSEDEIMTRLNAAMNKGLVILEVRRLEESEKTGAAIVTAADYRVTLNLKTDKIEGVVKELMALDTMDIERTSKHKTKVVNIRPFIYELAADNSGEKTVLSMKIAAGSANNLKPELLCKYIYEYMGLEFAPYELVIERLNLLKGDSEQGFSYL